MNSKMSAPDERLSNATETVQIRVHGIDGSIRTFTQRFGSLVGQTLNWFQPTYIFAQKRIEIPDERSLTTFFSSQVTRIDLITEPRSNWSFPPDLVEAVELSERAFRALAQPQQPRERQETPPSRDNAAMVFLILPWPVVSTSSWLRRWPAGRLPKKCRGLTLCSQRHVTRSGCARVASRC